MKQKSMIHTGKFRLFVIKAGAFWLDGGAMFGVVPKVLWKRGNPPDMKNRIELQTNCLLIDTGKLRILVDTGLGNRLSKKERNFYSFYHENTFISSIVNAGFQPEDINIVILSHLHFDHAGGATAIDSHNTVIPTFPSARYIVQKKEWEDGIANFGVMNSSYKKDLFIPLEDAKRLELVQGNCEITPGVSVNVSGGHTRAHQIIKIESEGETAFYPGDIIPTSAHVKGPYIAAYDLYPLDIKQYKLSLLEEACETGATIFFYHDPVRAYGTITKLKEEKYSVLP